jgi:hypothetical protein
MLPLLIAVVARPEGFAGRIAVTDLFVACAQPPENPAALTAAIV